MSTRPDLLRKMMADAGLSDTARLLGFHIYAQGAGRHEISHEEFARVAQGTPTEETVRRHLRQLRVHGYVTQHPGGKGHSPSYEFPPSQDVGLSDSPPKNTGAKDDPPTEYRGPNPPMGGTIGGESVSLPPTNQPTNRPAGAREGEPSPHELQALRVYLGADRLPADPVALFARSADHGGMWAGAILANYGPGGSREVFWRGVPDEERPGVLATALTNYASDAGKPYDARLFDRYMERARDQRDPAVVPLRRPPSRASPSGRDQPSDAQEYTPTTEFRGLNA